MSWRTPLLDKTYDAAAAIEPYRFCKFDSSDATLAVAAANTDALLGVSGQVGAAAAGDRIDATLIGIGEVQLGGSVTRGNQLTSDSDGKAVVASDGNSVGGIALMSGEDGDVIPILLHAAGDSDARPLYYADVTISSAELLALNATPKQLVAAPGAGLVVVPELVQAMLDYATTAYDGIAAAGDIAICYTDSSGGIAATIGTTGFLDQEADTHRVVGVSVTAFAPAANAALVAHMLAGEITAGDSPLKLRVWYRVLPLQS
jgi:hypothetical protein